MNIFYKRKTGWLSGHIFAGAVIASFVLLWAANVGAYNVYTFTDAACERNSGMILMVNDDLEITLLRLDGSTITLPANEVNQIMLYSTDQNPIEKVNLNNSSGQYLIGLKLYNEAEDIFGWFLEYTDDLLVFYSLQGKQYLIEIKDIEQITELDSAALASLKFSPETFKSYHLSPGIEDACAYDLPEAQQAETKAIPPFRHIKDKVEVIKFINQKKDEFFQTKGLSVKTHYYTKPVMFFPRHRFRYTLQRGETVPSSGRQNIGGSMYFGSPYATQTAINLFNVMNKQLPIFDFLSALETEVKSYFFHAGFIGNFNGLQPKSQHMINNQPAFYQFFEKLADKNVYWVTNFNRLIFSGFDYNNHSFFVGQFYPLFGILPADGYFREVFVGQYAPLGIYKYTKNDSSYEVIVSDFQADQKVSAENTDSAGIKVAAINELEQAPTESVLAQIGGNGNVTNVADKMTHYKIMYRYIRFNYTFDYTQNLQFLFYQTIDQKKYTDNLFGADTTFTGETYQTLLGAGMQFGAKIRTQFYAAWIVNRFGSKIVKTDGTTIGKSNNSEESLLSVSLEFLL